MTLQKYIKRRANTAFIQDKCYFAT